ncbi:MAG: hypothetical protein PHE79_01905 [Eubacteriales bacterium]|nr:hypothetical protein [Eubacteriales bacterium]
MEVLKTVFDTMMYVSLGIWGWVILALVMMSISYVIEKTVRFIIKIIAKFRKPKAAEEIDNNGI